MKKSILILALMAFALFTFGQTKQPGYSIIDTAVSKHYAPDPKRVYQIELSADQIGSLVQSSQAGVVPYLKSVKLPMDKLDNAQAYFNSIAATVSYQFRLQYVADSLKAVKPTVTKK